MARKFSVWWSRGRKWIAGQLSQLTLVGVLLILWSFIPDTHGRWEFWHSMLPFLRKVFVFSLTTAGRFILLMLGFGLIVLDKLGLFRRKYDLTTLKGRTLKLRDEIQGYL